MSIYLRLIIIIIVGILLSGCIEQTFPSPTPELTPTPEPTSILTPEQIPNIPKSKCPEGYILGEDNLCHQGCGDGYCSEGSICCNNKCYMPCPSGYVMGEDCICHQGCGDGYCSEGSICCNNKCYPPCPSGCYLTVDCMCYCSSPTPSYPPTPTPQPSKSDEEVGNFILYCQKQWVYEYDQPGELCQGPIISYNRMEGDCDDFAVMIAYYLEEIYGYDTFIVRIQHWRGEGHFVCFVAASDELVQDLANQCGTTIPIITYNSQNYIPLDWEICPDWTWKYTGEEMTLYEWEDLVGKAI